ncbi:hypothetical protein LTR91_022587 [Friedmanniomyces endolithicus]|nr:hypothetical protein LTS09_006743 [Friedmanniomyces endolithicus]KAK0282893.1 hypothetical protein LTR35_006685 [Friedmanniomyces endolithicus]KAK0297051.1 hypothetical protein LTS00_004330 [Friedmanniomyces endolithicus]KAK0320739.1 hypothetical protein LTR82_008452 [Friedmanniomyces endolithicus]KAK0928144.1 hypothetical protein LTR57_002878 [Friedmanniomyces endolithicus]
MHIPSLAGLATLLLSLLLLTTLTSALPSPNPAATPAHNITTSHITSPAVYHALAATRRNLTHHSPAGLAEHDVQMNPWCFNCGSGAAVDALQSTIEVWCNYEAGEMLNWAGPGAGGWWGVEGTVNDVNLKILAIPNLAGCGTHTLTDSECVLAYQATLSG